MHSMIMAVFWDMQIRYVLSLKCCNESAVVLHILANSSNLGKLTEADILNDA